jgi:competence protein ComEC
MTTSAAWVIAAAAWVGALLGLPGQQAAWSPASWPPGVAMALGAVGVLLALAAVALGDRNDCADLAGRPARPARLVLLALATAIAVAAAAGGRAAIADTGVLARMASEPMGTVTVTATAVTELDGPGGGWQILRVDRVAGRRVRERAWWRLDARQAENAPVVGQRVRAEVRVAALNHHRLGAHAARLHAVARLRPVQAPRIVGEPGWLLGSTQHVRQRFATAARRHLDDARAGVLTALVTGDRRNEPDELHQTFVDAGLAHLVVVSGKHVALVLGGVLALAGLAGLGPRSRRGVALGALAWFVLLTRWQPSVLRAAAMGALVLAAGMAGRGVDARHALAVAVTVLLLADPFLAGQLGFGLSVGATAGVLVLAPWLGERLPGPRWLALPAGITLGAQLGAAPLLLTLDGISAGSLPANLVAVPAAAAAQAIGIVAAVIAQGSIAAAGVVAALAGPPLSLIVVTAETFAAGPRVTADALASPVLLLTLALVAAAMLARRRWPRAPHPVGVAVAALAGVLAPLPSLPPADVEHLTVTILDVGQGLAVLLEVPDGQGTARMLYDAGPEGAATLDHLADRRIQHLDVLALSHAHDDHSGGMPAVLDELDVDRLVVGPQKPRDQRAESVHRTYRAAAAADVAIDRVRAGRRFTLGEARVKVLSPPGDGSLGREPNSLSVVLRVTAPDGRVLLAGDAEHAAQRRLLRRAPGRLPAAVLQVAHHGGATNAARFHGAVDPAVGVISVGAGNPFGHPDPRVIQRLGDADTRVYRTDRHGTVTLTLVDGRVRAQPQRRPRRARRGRRGRRGGRAHASLLAMSITMRSGSLSTWTRKGRWLSSPTAHCMWASKSPSATTSWMAGALGASRRSGPS